MYSEDMNPRFSLASTAGLIADPARAAMLSMLLDARPRSAGELARAANVSAQSASMHLSQLLTGGFLQATREGRHRYYRIASGEIAQAIEALGAISLPTSLKPVSNDRDLCYARTCYDHLAGELGVQLTEALEGKRVLRPYGEREYDLTREGEKFLAVWGIDAASLRANRRTSARRVFARRCLDWTERRYHVAGALGAAICEKFVERRWITREKNSRIVHLSPNGRRALESLLSLP